MAGADRGGRRGDVVPIPPVVVAVTRRVMEKWGAAMPASFFTGVLDGRQPPVVELSDQGLWDLHELCCQATLLAAQAKTDLASDAELEELEELLTTYRDEIVCRALADVAGQEDKGAHGG